MLERTETSTWFALTGNTTCSLVATLWGCGGLRIASQVSYALRRTWHDPQSSHTYRQIVEGNGVKYAGTKRIIIQTAVNVLLSKAVLLMCPWTLSLGFVKREWALYTFSLYWKGWISSQVRLIRSTKFLIMYAVTYKIRNGNDARKYKSVI
jgi:hypothetical protein